MLNYSRGEFHPCLEDRGEISVGARFHLGGACVQKDKFGQSQGQTQARGEIHPGVKLYV